MKTSSGSPTNKKQVKSEGHPSGDDRFKALDRTMKRFNFEKDSLLEVLHDTQEIFGFLSDDLLIYISTHLRVPLSQVYGVATFYHFFTFEPLGKHNCIICRGTACHVKGSDVITQALSEEFAVPIGKTTEDGLFSLTTARCIGSCGLAPVAVLNGAVHGKQTPQSMITLVKDVLEQETEVLEQGEAG
ncbi:MAG: bidirectional hydrogenase complex protein HoxE [Anaerolineaceae bacterium]|nr:MAG: bidirectional hydrogenase complex protein HoxE [Anaerolineaceae bacterium]